MKNFLLMAVVLVLLIGCQPTVTPAPVSTMAPTAVPTDTVAPTPVPSPTPTPTSEPEPARLLTLQGVHSDWIFDFALSRDGARLVSSSNDERGVVWDLNTGELMCKLEDPRGLEFVWRPDGREIAGDSIEGIGIWDAESCALERVLEYVQNEGGSVNQAPGSWSPDGEALAMMHLDGRVLIRDKETGEVLLTLRGHRYNVWNALWSPDGSKLLAGAEEGDAGDVSTVVVWDMETGERLHTWEGYGGGVWSADGSKVALQGVYDLRDRLTVVDVDSGEELEAIDMSEADDYEPVWLPGGLVNLIVPESDPTQVMIRGDEGQVLHTLEGHSARVTRVGMSPDGAVVACGLENGTIVLWALP